MASATASDLALNLSQRLASTPTEPTALSPYAEPVLQLAWWVGLGAIALSVVIFLAVIVLRLRLFLRQRRERAVIEQWRPLIAQCAERAPDRLPVLQRVDHDLVLRLWNHYHESLRGAASEELNRFAIEAGIDEVARNWLSRSDTRSRLLALVTLGHLRDKTRWHEMRLLAEAPSPVLSLAAARAMLRIEPRTTLTWFLWVAARRTDWPLSRIATVLTELGAELITLPVVVTLEQLTTGDTPVDELVRLLRLLEVVHAERAAPIVRRILKAAGDERILAGCLRSLQSPDDVALFRSYASHASWIVRVAALRQLARFGTPEDRPLLVERLADHNWWVRYRAAQALLALPGTDRADVEKIRGGLPDRFARDILEHVLAEKS